MEFIHFTDHNKIQNYLSRKGQIRSRQPAITSNKVSEKIVIKQYIFVKFILLKLKNIHTVKIRNENNCTIFQKKIVHKSVVDLKSIN